jgi:hypothetical protein
MHIVDIFRERQVALFDTQLFLDKFLSGNPSTSSCWRVNKHHLNIYLIFWVTVSGSLLRYAPEINAPLFSSPAD